MTPQERFGADEAEDGFGGGTNRGPVVEGIEEVSQDPDLFADDDDVVPAEEV